MIPTPEEAWELLCEYNEGEFHRKHGRIVGDVLRWDAVKLGSENEADFWQAVGILHDLDFEQWPQQHCLKEQELLQQKDVDERLIHAVVSHGYKLTVDVAPQQLHFPHGLHHLRRHLHGCGIVQIYQRMTVDSL